MIAFLSFFEAMQIGILILFSSPGRAVNSLQHFIP
jgi:hypothetical protein